MTPTGRTILISEQRDVEIKRYAEMYQKVTGEMPVINPAWTVEDIIMLQDDLTAFEESKNVK